MTKGDGDEAEIGDKPEAEENQEQVEHERQGEGEKVREGEEEVQEEVQDEAAEKIGESRSKQDKNDFTPTERLCKDQEGCEEGDANLPAADEERSEVATAEELSEDVDAQSEPEDTGDKNFDHNNVVQGAYGDQAEEDPEIRIKEKRSITSTYIPEGSGESVKTEKRRKHTAHKGKGRIWRVECHTHAMEHIDPTEVGVAVEAIYPELENPERILYDADYWNIGPDDVRGDAVWGYDDVTLTFRSFAPATQAHRIRITTSNCSWLWSTRA